MTERQLNIVQAIVNEYLHSGTPVGSSALVDKFSMPMSSATVRKEMSVLEQMGFLTSPHTSAGRVPTENALELYTDTIIRLFDINTHQKTRLDEFFEENFVRLEDLFKTTAHILSQTSHSAGIVLAPIVVNSILSRIELVHIHENQVLMVVVSNSGNIFQKHIQLARLVQQEELYKVSRFLNQNLKGYELSDLQEKSLDFLDEQDSLEGDLSSLALQIAQLLIYSPPDQQVFINGEKIFYRSLLEHISNKQLAEKIIRSLDDKGFVCDLLDHFKKDEHVHTQFGLEIDGEKIDGVSVISTGYFIGGRRVGSLGVVGITRMPYDKVIPTLNYTSRLLSKTLRERNEVAFEKDFNPYSVELRHKTTIVKLGKL